MTTDFPCLVELTLFSEEIFQKNFKQETISLTSTAKYPVGVAQILFCSTVQRLL